MAIYSKKSVSIKYTVLDTNNIEIVLCKVNYNGKYFQVINLYRSPRVTDNCLLEAFTKMSHCLDNTCPFVLMGDFNFDILHESKKNLMIKLCGIL